VIGAVEREWHGGKRIVRVGVSARVASGNMAARELLPGWVKRSASRTLTQTPSFVASPFISKRRYTALLTLDQDSLLFAPSCCC
jgi:hypothetical protein